MDEELYSLDGWHKEQMKNWRYRFWWYIHTPGYWLDVLRYRWLRRKGGEG